MPDITIINATDVQNTLQGSFKPGFKLTSYADDSTVTIISGTYEEVGSQLYRVDGGDLAVTDSASNGNAYLYLSDDGDGTGTAELLNTVPTYDSIRGGFYSSAKKAILFLRKNGSTYYNKTQILDLTNINHSLYKDYNRKLNISDFTVNYSGDQVSTITGTNKFGNAITYTYTYSGDQLTQSDLKIGDITYREVYNYSGNKITTTTLTVV